jgi:hypothetical protein
VNKFDRFNTIALTVATVAAAVLPVLVTVFTFHRQTPPKQIEIWSSYISPSEVIGDLPKDASISIEHNGERYSNLAIVTAAVRNSGTTPIVDSDVQQTISITTPTKWRLIAIKPLDNEIIGGSPLLWEADGPNTVRAKRPFLLNPREYSSFSLYYVTSEPEQRQEQLELSWSARIVNLAELTIYEPLGISPESHKTHYAKRAKETWSLVGGNTGVEALDVPIVSFSVPQIIFLYC